MQRITKLLKRIGFIQKEEEHVAPLRIRRSCILLHHVVDQDGKTVYCTSDEKSAREFMEWYNKEENQ